MKSLIWERYDGTKRIICGNSRYLYEALAELALPEVRRGHK